MTFGEWFHKWMDERVVAATNHANRMCVYNKHIKPHFGHMPLVAIGEHDILIFRKLLLEKNLQARTVNRIVDLVKFCMNRTYKRGMLSVNPAAEIVKLKESLPDIDPFTFQELDHLLRYLATSPNGLISSSSGAGQGCVLVKSAL